MLPRYGLGCLPFGESVESDLYSGVYNTAVRYSTWFRGLFWADCWKKLSFLIQKIVN
ncbi:hypothetical protein M595_3814 [Lyngbya aestuarii BL J]|uniref:Uncharacterized protein n=1 Tax=Lyngbya aestuarii BL J TaxID=1348334 RepID=U7QE78_9CYAN|nr:hypothetical protein M595_3814 [Lyngbya aestuarii BL J]